MASAGDVIENPIQGDRIVFRSTARETHGEALALEVFVSSGAAGSPYHIHPGQEERFKVIAGLIRARIDGRDHRFTTGDECVVAPGLPRKRSPEDGLLGA